MCCHTAVVAAAAAAVRHRVAIGSNCCSLIESDSIQFFLPPYSNRIYFNECPLAVLLSHFTPSICLYTTSIQPRSLRACAGPRRASGRRGEAPLVYLKYTLVRRIYEYECIDVKNSGVDGRGGSGAWVMCG